MHKASGRAPEDTAARCSIIALVTRIATRVIATRCTGSVSPRRSTAHAILDFIRCALDVFPHAPFQLFDQRIAESRHITGIAA